MLWQERCQLLDSDLAAMDPSCGSSRLENLGRPHVTRHDDVNEFLTVLFYSKYWVLTITTLISYKHYLGVACMHFAP